MNAHWNRWKAVTVCTMFVCHVVVLQGICQESKSAAAAPKPLLELTATTETALLPNAKVLDEVRALREDVRRMLDLMEAQAKRSASIRATQNADSSAELQREMVLWKPTFLDVESVLNLLQSMLSEKGQTQILIKENAIAIFDTAEHLGRIKKLVAELDVPPTLVRVRVHVFQVDADEVERARSIMEDARVPATGSEQVGAFLRLYPNLLQAELRKQCPSVKTITSPTLAVVDRQQAQIKIVEEVPVQHLTQTEGGGNLATTSFREAGLSLSIRPTVCPGDLLQLELAPEFSSVSGYSKIDPKYPIIDRRTTSTTIRIKSGDCCVLTGLCPSLFSEHTGDADSARNTSELLMLVSPEILRDGQLVNAAANAKSTKR